MPVTARVRQKAPAAAESQTLMLAVFAAAIFLSAVLIFALQPMFTKMVLPALGGSPSVWSVAMVFFQAMLLAGYAYAHFLTRYLPMRFSVLVHLGVMIVATLALPLVIAQGWGRPPAQGEILWLLGLFTISIGLPFFALSANAPLLQAWFARTDHPAAKNPYFLYAASNAGSFLALLSYPFLIEPFLRLGNQTRFWTIGFYGLIALIVVCGLLVLRSRSLVSPPSYAGGKSRPTWRDALVWVVLAAVPSAFLIAVTAHMSTDVASSPLLWVVPLAFYLLTFVIVFQTKPAIPHRFALAMQPFLIALLVAVQTFSEIDYIFFVLAINIVAFFVTALVCHGELAQRRPAPRYLTEFFLWMSVGGVIGGISAGLIAPHVFNWVAEYPLLIVAGLLCRPGLRRPKKKSEWLLWAIAIALTVLMVVSIRVWDIWPERTDFNAMIGLVLLVAVIFLAREPLKFAGAIAFALIIIKIYYIDGTNLDSLRSFFGVNRIYASSDGRFHVFLHGTTIHGAQKVLDQYGVPIAGRPETITYFHPESPMGRAFAAAHEKKRGPLRIAVVGLGAGTLACHTLPDDRLDMYEIDPAVVRIATDPTRFTYISACKPDTRIVVGDARITLGDAADGIYDVIVMDAFNSDSVPVHLLTREAMALYLKKLAPGGMVISHVMNRHMELASVVAGIARANGLVTWVSDSDDVPQGEYYIYNSTAAVVARTDEDLGTLVTSGQWRLQQPDSKQWDWTDDYSNIIGAMIRHLRQ